MKELDLPNPYTGTGNRCGHDPLNPDWGRFRRKTKKRLPDTVQRLIDGVQKYYSDPMVIPTLATLNGKTNLDGSPRQNRSEARESECLILKAVVSMTEYASLRVGTPLDNGDFINRQHAEIAQVSGLTREDGRPSKRYWRAFNRLVIAGAFNIFIQYEELPGGRKRARPAIKTVNRHFIVALGIVSYERLKQLRDYASDKLKSRREAWRKANPRKSDAEQARGALVRRMFGAEKKQAPEAKEVSTLKEQYNKEKIELTCRLADDGMSPTAAGREVNRQIGTFEAWQRRKQT